MTFKPQFWAEADMILSDSATLSISNARNMAECFFRDAMSSTSDRLAADSLALLTDLLPAIREATHNHMKRVAA